MINGSPRKWVGISGTWRVSTSELERDVKREVAKTLAVGNGIVTGGALGVDYVATAVTLKLHPDGSRLKVFLPTSLKTYTAHYQKRANEGVITHEQAEKLIAQLEQVNACGSLVENPVNTEVNINTYYLRDTDVVNASDELLAFHVNSSSGTQDTIDKAHAKGIPVKVFSYTADQLTL